MSNLYEDMLSEWDIDYSKLDEKDIIGFGLLATICHYVQKINTNLEQMKKQEKDYWETWKKAKEAES